MEKKNSVICDSDVIIDLFDKTSKRHNDILKEFRNLENNEISVYLSIITKMELIQGTKNKKEINELKIKLARFDTFYLTENISRLAFNYIKDFSKSHSLQIPDALIAATSVIFNLTLYTYNKKDFKYIPEIHLYNS